MFANWQHVRQFRHWPLWVQFHGFSICERCIKPPSRPQRLRPVFVLAPRPLH